MQYGSSIRAHRKALKLTQPEFARRLGVPDSGTISRWELGKSIPSPERLEQLRQDGADVPPRIEPRTLGQRVAALEEAVARLLATEPRAARHAASSSHASGSGRGDDPHVEGRAVGEEATERRRQGSGDRRRHRKPEPREEPQS